MRNYAQQKRVFDAVLFMLAMWLVFAAVFIFFFLNSFFPKASYFNYADFSYMGETVDEAFSKGAVVFVHTNDKEFEENDKIAYLQTSKDGKKEVQTVKFATYIRTVMEIKGDAVATVGDTVVSEDAAESTGNVVKVYLIKIVGEDVESYATIADSDMLGQVVASVPYIGYALYYMNYVMAISVCAVIVFAVLLVVLPIMLVCKRRRLNNLPSPFPCGLDVSAMSKENAYIYEDLMDFFRQTKRFSRKRGFDCVKIYTLDKKLFATVVHVNKKIQVLINKDFARDDNRVDRSAFITIYSAVDLPDVKDKIYEIYTKYFKKSADAYRKSAF